ncbi:flavodoxin domain-containing protein [Streptomyces sp. E11-3]|uniref:flavodoxin domain-containing protein n=1 Tax=Streptomyces sp. E11-3 TaxID=3110112 RepID=UPI003980734B
MTRTVLIAYGTKNGSTAEISYAIAEVLREGGFTAQVRPAALVGDLRPYDAVVIGGALYMGLWHRDARRFARRHRRSLTAVPVWLFSSGPLDGSATEKEIPPVLGVRRLARRVGARGHATFGGRLEEGAKGRMARRLIKNGQGGDFRDFTQIRAWAADITTELTKNLSSPGTG